MISRFTLYTILAALCTARLTNDQDDLTHRITLSLAERICWADGKECEQNTTCVNCCSNTTTTNDATNVTTCGDIGACIEDGTICMNETDYLCNRCCNGAYANDRTTCGGTCIENGISCNNLDNNYTCGLCCNDTYYKNDNNEYQCGCIEDGMSCIPGDTCYSCCNSAFDNNGTTCGGQCLESGTPCEITYDPEVNPTFTCSLCCNYTYFTTSASDELYQCGCIEDGESCIPGDTCYSCCNSAYDDTGSTCGGTCINDGTVCTPGENCHLCCTYADYWYSTDKMHCGVEPCYPNGETCIPGQTCSNCCSGGAYDGDGTICGGNCLQSGSECTYYGTCSKCCIETITTVPGLLVYPIGNNPHWNETSRSMVCGYEQCWADGTDCHSSSICATNCCNSTYGSSGVDGRCGGQCLADGSKCNFYSTCSACCNGSKYNTTLKHHVCFNSYNEYQYPTDGSASTTSTSTDITIIPTSTTTTGLNAPSSLNFEF